MVSPLKVRVFKKSKDASIPEHIVVERSATHELVHMHFNEGSLAKFTHFVRDPQTKMMWDGQEKKYKALPSRYTVSQQFSVKDGKATYLKGPEDQSFFCFFDAPPWNSSSIAFKPYKKGLSGFYVETDLKLSCIPNAYIRDDGVADIQEIYTHQSIATQSNMQPIKNQETKQDNHQLKTTWEDVLKGMLILPVVVYEMAKSSFPSEESPFIPKKIPSHKNYQNIEAHQNQR